MGAVVQFRRPGHAEALVKFTATLSWLDQQAHQHRERFAAWTAREATRQAWVRASSLRLSGEASAFRIDHHEQANSQ